MRKAVDRVWNSLWYCFSVLSHHPEVPPCMLWDARWLPYPLNTAVYLPEASYTLILCGEKIDCIAFNFVSCFFFLFCQTFSLRHISPRPSSYLSTNVSSTIPYKYMYSIDMRLSLMRSTLIGDDSNANVEIAFICCNEVKKMWRVRHSTVEYDTHGLCLLSLPAFNETVSAAEENTYKLLI